MRTLRVLTAALLWVVLQTPGTLSAEIGGAEAGVVPAVASGRIERLAEFESRRVPARHVDVWLPDGYPEAGPYAVLYMADGQMLFDAGITWNGQEWRADETAGELIASGRTRPFIIVGVWNIGSGRGSEYFPQKPFEALSAGRQRAPAEAGLHRQEARLPDAVDSDNYLKFLVEELKPHIDRRYAVSTAREDTFVIGSSMGGLISIYALTEYPEVFGGTAGLSTHWPGTAPVDGSSVPPAFFDYLDEALPAPGRHRFWFDHGTETLDAHYAPLQRRVDALLRARGYGPEDWRTVVFPGAGHAESAWADRLHLALRFLVEPDDAAAGPRRPIEDEVVYFVMPDRFANGDPSNDRGGREGGRLEHGFDPTDKGFYHGGDLNGLTARLDYIQGLGATALWLTPVFENKWVQGPKGEQSASYHGYWITDFTRVDPHLGTNADLKALVEAAHARGMKVILDIVVNHTADVIQYRECIPPDEGGSGEAWPDCSYRSIADYPYTTRGGPDGAPINAGFTGDDEAGQTMENFARLTDPNWAYMPFVPEAERGVKHPPWLNDILLYHNRGNSHWEGESALHGDFSGLDDLFTEHPRVLAGMTEIYRHWISAYRIDGYRIDTARHVNDSFWRDFNPDILEHARAQGIEDFYLFGEAYEITPEGLSRYTRDAAFPAVLDFAFQKTALAVVVDGAPPSRLAELFSRDAMYEGDARGAGILPTFLGNHDDGRLGHFLLKAYGAAADDAGLLARARLAHALLFFSRGVPVIYYGDEQGFTGDGGDKDARESMFPSQVAVYNDNRLIGTTATTADDNFDPEHPLYRAIAAMAEVYHAEPGLRRGTQTVRLAENRPGLFAFSRRDSATGQEYLVVLNTAERTRRARVPVPASGGAWRRLLGDGETLRVARRGRLTVEQLSLSFAVYKAVLPADAPRQVDE